MDRIEILRALKNRGYTKDDLEVEMFDPDAESSTTTVSRAPDTTGEALAKDVGSAVGEMGGGALAARAGKSPFAGAVLGGGAMRAAVGVAQDIPEYMSGDMSGKELMLRASINQGRGSAESVLGETLFRGAKWLVGGSKMSQDAIDFVTYLHSKLPDLPTMSFSPRTWTVERAINTGRRMLGVTKPAAATPDDIATSEMYKTFGNIVRTSVFGGARTRALDARNLRILTEEGEDLAKAWGAALPQDKFGEAIVAALDHQVKAADGLRMTAKNTLAKSNGAQMVDLAPITAGLRKVQKTAKALSKDPKDPLNLLDDFESTILNDLGDQARLDKVLEFRDILHVKGRTKMVEQLDTAVTKALKGNKPALSEYKEYLRLGKLTAGEESVLQNKFISQLISQTKGKAGYESVADLLVPSAGADSVKHITNVRRLRDAFAEQFPPIKGRFGKTVAPPIADPWREVQAMFNQRIFGRAMGKDANGAPVLKGMNLLTVIQKPEMKELISEVYSPEHYRDLVKFGKNLANVQVSSGARGKFGTEVAEQGALRGGVNRITGNVLQIFGLGSAATAAATGEPIAASVAGVAALPKLLDYALTDPVVVKWWTQGLAHPKEFGITKAASVGSARLSSLLANSYMEGGDMSDEELNAVFGGQ